MDCGSGGSRVSDGDVGALAPEGHGAARGICSAPRGGPRKQELLDLVRPEVTVGDASLAVVVRELREALGDQADAP